MNYLKYERSESDLYRKSFLILLLVILVSSQGCQGKEFYFQSFTFPSSIPAHESGWTYMGQFTVATTAKGNMLRQSDKTVRIAIVNADEIEVFSYEIRFKNVAGLKAEINWKEIDSLHLKILEYTAGQTTVEVDRDESGGQVKVLQTIHIIVDEKLGTFVLSTN